MIHLVRFQILLHAVLLGVGIIAAFKFPVLGCGTAVGAASYLIRAYREMRGSPSAPSLREYGAVVFFGGLIGANGFLQMWTISSALGPVNWIGVVIVYTLPILFMKGVCTMLVWQWPPQALALVRIR